MYKIFGCKFTTSHKIPSIFPYINLIGSLSFRYFCEWCMRVLPWKVLNHNNVFQAKTIFFSQQNFHYSKRKNIFSVQNLFFSEGNL